MRSSNFPRAWGLRFGVLQVMLAVLLGMGGLRAVEPEPKKEAAVAVLQGLLAALEARDYPKALGFFQMPPKATPEELRKAASRLIELREISKAGIEVLENQGRWGKLAETLEPARAQRFAERFGVPVVQCYGLTLGNAEAGFYWDGQTLKVIRCDDIGKLESN